MRKSQIIMSQPVHLGLSILDISKTVIHEFPYDYVRPKFDENCVIWIEAALLFMQKQKILIKIL